MEILFTMLGKLPKHGSTKYFFNEYNINRIDHMMWSKNNVLGGQVCLTQFHKKLQW